MERVLLDEPGLGDQSGGSTESVTKLVRLYPEDLIESARHHTQLPIMLRIHSAVPKHV